MKKIRVDGINGYIEANSKYVYVLIGKKDGTSFKEHVVLFDEIEDIFYKKPTREKYGFLTLYLSTKSYVSNSKIKYTLILDKIDQMDLEANKKLFDFIKSIIKNKEVEVKEIIETSEEKKEEDEEEKSKEKIVSVGIVKINENKEKEVKSKDDNKRVVVIEKPKKENTIEYVKKEEINKEKVPLESKKEVKKDTIEEPKVVKEIIIDSIKENEEQEEFIEIANNDLKEEIELKNIDTQELIEVTKEEELEEEIEEDKDELEEEKNEEKETINNTHFKTIEKLEKKILDLEKELNVLAYKELILNNYIDETKERSKIEKYILDLNKILEKLQKIKKEISKQEKTISENDIISIENGNVIITSIGRLSLDDKKKEVEKYIDYYKSVINKIDTIEKDTNETSKEAEFKKKELKISEEKYEESINSFKNVKSNKELISNYMSETKKDLSRVKKRIEKTVNPRVKYKYVRRSISEQTKRLAALQALNSLRPGRSRFSVMAVSLLTGVSSISDLLGYDLKKVEYNEVVIKEMIVGLDYIDTSKARYLIESSKDQIDSILRDCDRMYLDYPKYQNLRKDLLSIKNDIDKQDEELRKMEEQIKEYNLDAKVKVLKYQE